jgi:hypothetical protein
MADERHPRPRIGKTAKDKKRGVLLQNTHNKDVRSEYYRYSVGEFPSWTCNGKKTRALRK